MGYTHSWTQKRNFTIPQWQQVVTDLRAILNHAQNVEGIVLADGMGEPKTSPEFTDDHIAFNGLGEDSHETFYISRKRAPLESWETKDRLGWAFTKTERKPYDVVVTACLCYLSTVTRKEEPMSHEPIIGTEAFSVSSDGDGNDFVAGLDLARVALPQYGNVLDIPMDVMERDRWCAPWVRGYSEKTGFEVHFCIDGHGYILRPRTKQSYRFETHEAMAAWLHKNRQWGTPYYSGFEPDIWDATGSFGVDRHDRIARAQKRALSQLFPVPMSRAYQPPAYVRPGQMPENSGREFCYSVTDLLERLEKA